MSVEAMAVVLHHSKAKGTAKLVLLGIANHQGDGGSWPAVATLAGYANVSERQVQRALDTLRGLGEVRVDVQAGGLRDTEDHMRPNRYDVLVACPPWCDRTMNHRDTRRRSGRQVALPVDKPGDTYVTPSAKQADRVTPATPPRVTPTSPEPSIEPGDNHPGHVSTEGEAAVVRDDERPPVPANPPADELARVRERLHQATEQHTKRENRTS